MSVFHDPAAITLSALRTVVIACHSTSTDGCCGVEGVLQPAKLAA